MANKSNIGAGLALDGEKEFKSAVSNINKDLSVLSSEMGKVTAQFSSNANSMEALKAKSEVYNKQIDEQKNKIETLKSALANSSKEFEANDNRVKNWQIQLNKAEAELAKTENALQDTNLQMKNLEGGTDKAGNELKQLGGASGVLGDTFTNLGNKIGLPVDKLKALPAGSVAAVAAIGAIAIGCYKLIDALFDAGKQAGEFADNIITLSAKTHVGAQDLQQYAYYAELVDVPLDTVGTSLGKLTKSMASAQSGTGAQADAFKQLGVSITDANGNLRNSNDIFAESIDALGKVGNETEADALASQIFGRSFQDLNPLVAVGSEKMKEFADEAKRMGSNLSDEALKSLGEVDDAYQRLNSTQTNMTNAVGALVAPMQVKMVAAIAGMIGSMAAGLNEGQLMTGEFANTVATGITNAASAITQNISKFLDIGLKLVGNIMEGVGQSLPQVIPMLIQVLLDFVNIIIQNIPLFVSAAAQIVTGLALGLVNAIPTLVLMIPVLITSLVNAITGSVGAIVSAGIQLLTGLVGALPEIITAIVEVLPLIISAVVSYFTTALPEIINMGIELFVALIEALPEIITEIVSAMPQIINAIVNALTDNIELIIEAGVQLFVAIISNLPAIIGGIIKAIPQIISAIVSGIVGAVPQLENAGLRLIQGLWEGIGNAKDWLVSKISDFFGGIVDSIKKFFGIKSPSKLMADQVGKFLPQGIGEGFEKQMPDLVRNINGQMANLTNEISPNINVSGMSGSSNNTYSAAGMFTGATIVIRSDNDITAMAQAVSAEIYKLSIQGAR